MPTPDLSVVIPVLDAENTIAEQLDALAGQDWAGAWEVVVADNGCTDRTLEIVSGYAGSLPYLRIVDASDLRGVQHAMNVGVREARARAVAICDADDVVARDWVAAIGEALSEYPFVASRHEVELLNPLEIRRSRDAGQREGLQRLWYPPYAPHAGACGLGFWKAVWREVGGFDEDLPSLPDTDFCLKVHEQGTELRFVPEAVVHVRFRRDPAAIFRQAREWARYNCKLYRRYGSGRLPAVECWKEYWTRLRPLLKQWSMRLRRERGRRDPDPALLWRLGWAVGLLEGSLRERVPPVVQRPAAGRPERASTPTRTALDRPRRRPRDRHRGGIGTGGDS